MAARRSTRASRAAARILAAGSLSRCCPDACARRAGVQSILASAGAPPVTLCGAGRWAAEIVPR